MTKRKATDTAAKFYYAYRFQRADLTCEWRVQRRTGATYSKPLVKGVTRDEAWHAARSLAKRDFAVAVLLGVDGRTWRRSTDFASANPATTILRKTSDVAIASLQLHDAATWTPDRRASVVMWLRHCADFLKKNGPKLAKRYRARYFVHA